MTFKETLEQDIKNTFLSINEFAEWHEIDGSNVLCVIDKDVIHKRNALVQDSVFGTQLAVYLSAKDVAQPVRGQSLTIDGDLYLVQEVSENIGMYCITVEAVNG